MSEPLSILHLDDELAVVSKPAGLLVHRDRRLGRGEPVVLQAVSEQLGRYVYPVHRLDRNTSGVLCFALTREAARTMQERLAAEETRKEYLVLVRGETPEAFESSRPLTNDRGERRPTHTEFRRLATFSRCSLLTARITTGRRHQIRRHLAHLAHHVIGDTSYGKGRINAFFRAEYGLPRMFLHAARLSVAHPATGLEMELRAALAADLRAFLQRLPDVDPDLLASL
jgi:tRNA pseudouridine65 synthase